MTLSAVDIEAPTRVRSPLRNAVAVTAFVAVWIALGELIDADRSAARLNTYLLLGIPLGLAFQRLVARRPVTELWVRRAQRRPVARRTVLTIGLALAIYPAYLAVADLVAGQPASFVVYDLAAIGGAFAAGFAFAQFGRNTWRYLALCMAIVGSLHLVPIALDEIWSLSHPTADAPVNDLGRGILSLLLYLPAVFVIEEVVFRGVLDTHLHRDGTRGLVSAIYLSALWGIWHAPAFGWDAATLVKLLVGQITVGIFFSIYWRKSGNLGVSGATHAFIDALRNATVGLK